MNELVQSGQFPGASGHHPDADQLSAFIEQALPAHEREQVLAHLALCPDCRETVALSLPELAASPAPAPARRPWLHGWPVFVPAALALAASVFFVVHLHHANTPLSVPTQMAASQQSQPMVHMQQAPVPSSASSVAQPQLRARIANRPATPSAPPPAQAPLQRRQLDSLIAAPEPAPPPPAAVAGEQAQSAPIPAPGGRFTSAAPAPNPSAPAASAPVGSEAQTAVDAGKPTTVNAAHASGNFVLALPTERAVPFKNPLPSGLAVSSIAGNGPMLLAIDARNALFLSSDSGEHWTAVSTPWRERAVHVSLVSRSVENAPSAGGASGRGVATFASAVRLQPATSASLTGTVTDASGAVIPGASVTVRNTSTSAEHTVTTDATGHYLAESLMPGSYSIKAAAPGFAMQRVTDVAVDASRQTTENLILQVGSVSQSVTVESSRDLMPNPPAAESKALKSAAVASLPSRAVFEITTDTGERWTSTDGILWQRE